MKARPAFLAVALIAALAAAWLHGRSMAPTRTVVQTHVVRVEQKAVVSASTAKDEQRTDHSEGQERIVTRWRVAPSPGCAPMEVVRVEHRAVEREVKEALLTKADSKQELTSSHTHHESVQLIERERPRYAVGVDGGLMFEDATALVRGRFEIRALGPLWVTAWADRYAAGTGLRLEW
jgi:hypothetical protein